MRTAHVILLSIAFAGIAAAGTAAQASDVPKAAPVDEAVADPATPRPEAAVAQDDRTVCTRERAIGSNRVQKVCRKASEMATLRGDTQGAIRNNTRPTGQFFEGN